MSSPRGIRFGKYTLLNRIAVGGMAEIFLARQEGLEGFEKTICIKRIRPHLSSQSNFVRMFLNEAKLAAQLNHPNIVQIYDLGRINDSYFIAMEHIGGRDMSRIVPKAERANIPFPMIYALRIASSVCPRSPSARATAGSRLRRSAISWNSTAPWSGWRRSWLAAARTRG
ncbi:MAG: serine/threonine protein kinase, partial [Myxococcota bacterium]